MSRCRAGPWRGPTGSTGARFSNACATRYALFRYLTRAAAITVLIILSGIIVSLVHGSLAGAADVRFRLPVRRSLEPGHREIRRHRADLRHHRHLAHRHADRGAGRPVHFDLPHRTVPAVAAPSDRHRHRAARRHPQHHLRHLGPVRVRAVPAADLAAVPDRYARARSPASAICSPARLTASAS